MPTDKFKRETLTIDSVIEDGFDITPADNTELNTVTRAIYIGTGGDLSVTLVSGAQLTFRNVIGGSMLPFRISQVHATGTTAADLVGIL